MERMIDLKKMIDERVQMIEINTQKVVKKEINKLKRDIINKLKNG